MIKIVFVVLRFDFSLNDQIPIAQLPHVVRVKSVHLTREVAESEVKRLNGLGRAHYVVQEGKIMDHLPVGDNATLTTNVVREVYSGWAVGEISARDPRTLEEKVQTASSKDGFQLLSWISESAEFEISENVWEHLMQERGVVLSLSLALIPNASAASEGIPDKVPTYLEIVSEDLTIDIASTDFRRAVEDLSVCLAERIKSNKPLLLFLGRYSQNSQISLRLSPELIELLWRHRVRFMGGTIADCQAWRRLRAQQISD